ncbi:unnamed protein product, partial [Amoebophrya sp. A120]
AGRARFEAVAGTEPGLRDPRGRQAREALGPRSSRRRRGKPEESARRESRFCGLQRRAVPTAALRDLRGAVHRGAEPRLPWRRGDDLYTAARRARAVAAGQLGTRQQRARSGGPEP